MLKKDSPVEGGATKGGPIRPGAFWFTQPVVAGLLLKLAGLSLMIGAPVGAISVLEWWMNFAKARGQTLATLHGEKLAIAIILTLGTATIGAFIAGRLVFRRGKKVWARHQADLARADSRAPILYLRSFQDDAKAAVVPEASGLQMMVGAATEEEQLARVMNEIGPFVAIGRPGETLPELGAARFYVGHEEWQDRVSELMARAQLVILRVGRTPGFFWEVQGAVKHIQPEKLVFLLPYSTSEYAAFRAASSGHFPKDLPEFHGGPSLSDSFLGGILYFERDWTPRILKLKIPFFLTILGRILNPMGALFSGFGFGKPFVPVFKRTLKPVLVQNQLKWKWPPRHPLLTVQAWIMIWTWWFAFTTWFKFPG